MRGHLCFNVRTYNTRANHENILKRLKLKSESKTKKQEENRTAASYLPRSCIGLTKEVRSPYYAERFGREIGE